MMIISFESSVCIGALFTFGRSTCTPVVRSGAVTMKMTRRTSMTSMSGVTLISFMPPMRRLPWREPPPAPANAISDASELRARCDVEREGVHDVRDLADAAREVVVGHDRRDRGDEADRRRDERLGDLRRDDREVRALLISDREERVHDSVDRSEEADEGRR